MFSENVRKLWKVFYKNINQPFEINFVFVLQLSEHEEDELFEFGTSGGQLVVPLSHMIQGFKTAWFYNWLINLLGFLMFSGDKEK